MSGNIIAMQVGAVPEEVYGLLGAQFFSYVLPWLLTFAVVYGILSHIGEKGLPQSNPARTIIGIVLAFIIAPALSPYVVALMRFSAGFVMLIAGFLIVIVLLEVLGIQAEKRVAKEIEGKRVGVPEKKPIFEVYPKLFAFVIGIIALLVFFGSGAAGAMGIQLPSGLTQNYPLLFFLGVMVLIVGWMVSGE